MAFLLDTFARSAFKRLIGKSHTSDTRDPANEPIPSTFTLSAQDIWAKKINPDPANAANSGIVSELVTLVLEPVSGTANSGKYAAYRCKLNGSVPSSLSGKINRLTGAVYTGTDYVGDIIPQSFGDGFRPKLFKSGVETPPLDASDWFLDTSAGVISQEEDSVASMIDYSTGGTLQCYIYIGTYVTDAITSATVQFYDYQMVGAGITGTIDGTNATFVLANTPTNQNSVHVHLNGLLTKDFVIVGNTVTMNSTSIPRVNDEFVINYRVGG